MYKGVKKLFFPDVVDLAVVPQGRRRRFGWGAFRLHGDLLPALE